MPRGLKTTDKKLIAICSALGSLRKDNNLTQQELADYLGWDRSDISAIENAYASHVDFLKLKTVFAWWGETRHKAKPQTQASFKASINHYFGF